MDDEQILAALAQLGAEWLMDANDEFGRPDAMRHLVTAARQMERQRCAALVRPQPPLIASDPEWIALEAAADRIMQA